MTLTMTTCHSDDPLRISDEQLEKLGEFYTSEYVALNQPWIRLSSFEEWLTRHIAGEATYKT